MRQDFPIENFLKANVNNGKVVLFCYRSLATCPPLLYSAFSLVLRLCKAVRHKPSSEDCAVSRSFVLNMCPCAVPAIQAIFDAQGGTDMALPRCSPNALICRGPSSVTPRGPKPTKKTTTKKNQPDISLDTQTYIQCKHTSSVRWASFIQRNWRSAVPLITSIHIQQEQAQSDFFFFFPLFPFAPLSARSPRVEKELNRACMRRSVAIVISNPLAAREQASEHRLGHDCVRASEVEELAQSRCEWGCFKYQLKAVF